MKKVFIITGEHSGDMHAGKVVEYLKSINPNVEVHGIGGENLKTSGSDQNPYWYEYTYKDKEREGSKSEKYSVVVKTEKDKTKTYDLKYDEWISLKKGQTLKLKVHIGGNAEIVFE